MSSPSHSIHRRIRHAHVLRAFTLIEMLVVVLVISLVLAMSVPAIMGTVQAMRLTQAGDLVMTLFSEAQETANTKGRPVEVRLYRSADTSFGDPETMPYDAIMLLEYYQPGENDPRGGEGGSLALTSPLAVVTRPLARLPGGTVMSATEGLSTLATSTDLDPSNSGGGGIQVLMRQGTSLGDFSNMPMESYKSFMLLPGGTSLSASPGSKWFVTVVDSNDVARQAVSLRNFYTVQIDPVTGRLTRYRPN